ncbi:MAG TPA: hypothetical protein VNH65_18645 [Candidatus Acidoferrum sp.]|nr:hypothetical protein [Candidatus Acidoferrum sp.]
MRIGIAITLAFSVAAFSGCQQHGNSKPGTPSVASVDTSPNSAIQTAIQAHLAHNSNLRLDSFDMEVKQVALDGDHARAQVEFHAKSGGGTMQLSYALVKRDGVWSVLESTPGGSNFSHPGLDKTQGTGAGGKVGSDSDVFQVLEKLHDGTDTSKKNLPRGHPPVAASPKNKQP